MLACHATAHARLQTDLQRANWIAVSCAIFLATAGRVLRLEAETSLAKLGMGAYSIEACTTDRFESVGNSNPNFSPTMD